MPAGKEVPPPKHLHARPALEETEARPVRTLAQSAHAPADGIVHATRVVRSWDGQRTRHSAEELGGTPQTVRARRHAFNERGREGLGMQPGAGRKPRLTQRERRTILALVKRPPAGQPTDDLTGERAAPTPAGEPEWTRETLSAAAQARGIQVARRHVRRLCRRAGGRGRRTRRWATRTDPDCAPQGRASSRAPPPP